MTHEKSCGGIVYRKFHGNTEILLIKHVKSGYWSFPKGHVENGETEEETAKREIKAPPVTVVRIAGGYIFAPQGLKKRCCIFCRPCKKL